MSYKFNPFTGTFDDVGSGSGSDPRVDDLIILTGVPVNSTDLGVFSGSIIPDNVTIKDALQEVETYIEGLPNPVVYRGVWDASTNTPTLANGIGTIGDLYRVNVAGTVDFGSGPISFEVGDSVVYTGTVWEKWDQTDQVISVNGQIGAVQLDAIDIPYDNSTSGLTAVDVQDAIDELAASSVSVQTKIEHVTLNGTDITNQYITLLETPISSQDVALDVIGGGPQFLTDDFIIVGNQLQFQNDLATGGASELITGDKLRVIYSY